MFKNCTILYSQNDYLLAIVFISGVISTIRLDTPTSATTPPSSATPTEASTATPSESTVNRAALVGVVAGGTVVVSVEPRSSPQAATTTHCGFHVAIRFHALVTEVLLTRT